MSRLLGSQHPSLHGSSKKRPLDITDAPAATAQVKRPYQFTSPPDVARLPLLPSLYHLAIAADNASSSHLQQAFVPSEVKVHLDAASPSITRRGIPYVSDPAAASKALGLQLFALDLLKLGLDSAALTDREKVAFSREFGVISGKILAVKHKDVQTARLARDAEETVAAALIIARQHSYLNGVQKELEIINARLAFLQSKEHVGQRLIRQALKGADDAAYRYHLYLLSLDMTPDLQVLSEMQREAQQRGHVQIVQLTQLIRLRLLFHRRLWDLVPHSLDDLAESVEYSDLDAEEPSEPWLAHLRLQYLLLRILYEGRAGNDSTVRRLLKRAYSLMDTALEMGIFASLKARGGSIDLGVGETAHLSVQATPPNITFLLIYLVTVVARRDYLGAESSCKALVHPRAMQEFEDVARGDDMWDLDFSRQGLADVAALRSQVNAIRCEAMLEEATAFVFRSNFDAADKVFRKLINMMCGVFGSLGPQLCLVKAQYAHILGRPAAAERYYHACARLILPGSELGQITEIGLLSALGSIESDHKRNEVFLLAERCRASSNIGLAMAGYLLSSLVDPNRTASKKSLAHAYELATRARNDVLRCLIFAFTTSTHLYGEEDKTLKQLETGKELAMLLGGRDREDKVGQTLLGLWFAYKLKEHHRRARRIQEVTAARDSVATHLRRLDEMRMRGRVFEEVSRAIAPILDRGRSLKPL